MQLAGGLLYRYQVNPRVGLRGNFMYGNVKGEDSQSTSNLFKNRNLDFTSSILELAGFYLGLWVLNFKAQRPMSFGLAWLQAYRVCTIFSATLSFTREKLL
jgi:hypothetical protein